MTAAIEGQVAKAEEGGSMGGGAQRSSTCDKELDAQKHPDKYQACLACEVQHRGMGTMEEDCKKAIPKPWR